MKRIRKTFTVLVTALIIALMAVFPTACGDDPGKEPGPSGGDVTYSVTLKRSGGTGFDNTLIMATGPKSAFGRTNSQGVWTFTGPKGKYDLEFDVPVGFNNTGTISDSDKSKTFTLTGSLVSTPMVAGKLYNLGDCMHDFEFVDSTGTPGKLSEIFKTKKAVMLNFWFANCGPCVEEFPGLQSAYEDYKDDLEIIAISRYDSSSAAETFRQNNGLTFRVVGTDQECAPKLHTNFNVVDGGRGSPTSVIIDREGVICFIESGKGTEDGFRREFERYTKPDDEYEQMVQFPNMNTQEKPNVSAPSSAKIAEAVNAQGFTAKYYHSPAEYNWPWIVSEGGEGIQTSNSGKLSSYSILYADFEAEAGKVLAFDYMTSTESDNDMFYVYIDGEIIQTYSGVSNEFKTCYAYVPLKTGKYTLALAYVKDETKNHGNDTVYVKNMRFADSVGERTEVLYRCATGGLNDTGDYNDYIAPVYNKADGYYHVGTENGPYVLADVLNPIKWEVGAWDLVSGGNFVYDLDGDGESEDYSEKFGALVAISSLSRRKGMLGVTKDLKDMLVALTALYGNKTDNENEWLDLCYYKVVYAGEAGEIAADPAEGLAAHNAYPATITEIGAELALNHVDKDRVLMPRGIWHEISPEETGIYRIRSVGEVDTIGWLYDENSKLIEENDRDENPANEQSYNFSITRVLEKGKSYYIAVDFNNIDYTGKFDFVVERMGTTGTLFTPAAAGGLYEYVYNDKEEVIGYRVANAVDYVLGNDNCYHVKNKDGSAGPMLYVNMLSPTGLFPDYSIEQIMSGQIYYCKNCGSTYPSSVKYFESAESVKCYCGNIDKSKFEKKSNFVLPTPLRDAKKNIITFGLAFDSGEDYNLVQVVPMYQLNTAEIDISSSEQYMQCLNQFGIKFTDYTDVIRSYVADAKVPSNLAKDPDEIGGNGGEAYAGYIPAAKELVDVLQKYIIFGDHSMSPELENTWLMTAYYFLPLA